MVLDPIEVSDLYQAIGGRRLPARMEQAGIDAEGHHVIHAVAGGANMIGHPLGRNGYPGGLAEHHRTDQAAATPLGTAIAKVRAIDEFSAGDVDQAGYPIPSSGRDRSQAAHRCPESVNDIGPAALPRRLNGAVHHASEPVRAAFFRCHVDYRRAK